MSRSAIFCAIATTIERCKTEGVVDVFQVVKAMRTQRPGAIQTVVYTLQPSLFSLSHDILHTIILLHSKDVPET